MNVCLISREFPPFFGGGIGTYTVQWSKALAAAGHTVIVVTVSDKGEKIIEQDGKVSIVRLPFIRGSDWSAPDPTVASPETEAAFRSFSKVSVFAMRIEQAMPWIWEEFKIDVIEAPDTGALGWFGLNSRRTRGTWRDLPAVVTTIHSPSAWIARHNRVQTDKRPELELAAMERDCARWSDGLTCPSRALATWSARYWGIPAERIEVIPYPLGDLQPRAEQSSQAADPGYSNGKFDILFAGRLEPRKGVDTLLAGFTIAAHENPSLHLTLAGDDMPDPSGTGRFGENSLSVLVPDSLRGRVRMLGKQSPEQLAALRAQANAVIIPSSMDNFPFTCVEAMAEGRLVIASSGGGTGEMVSDDKSGLVFNAAEAGSCGQALARAVKLAPADRQRLKTAAAHRILDLCGNQNIVQRRIAHYERAIDRAAANQPVRRSMPLAVINRGTGEPVFIRKLINAVREADSDFAHGWGRTKDGRVLVSATPTLESLALGPRAVGPVMATIEALERVGAMPLIRPADATPGEFFGVAQVEADCAWAILAMLAAAGIKGSVVPETVFDLTERDYHPEDRQMHLDLERLNSGFNKADAELKVIHASRGWKMLQKLYHLLHILRGRGLHRPDYHE